MAARRRMICVTCNFMTESQEESDQHLKDNPKHGGMHWHLIG